MSRKIVFHADQYYHAFNRGTEKIPIFREKGDLYYFFDSIILANQIGLGNQKRERDKTLERKKNKEIAKQSKKLVSIIAYCLLPNHFHLILREEIEGGISKFMQKLGTSYTMYFNQKYERNGVLFQGKFKATHLDRGNALEFTSVYVNLNYKHHQINPEKSLIKSSLFEYLGTEKGESICNLEEIKKIVKNGFDGVENYKKYLKNQSKYFIEKHGNNPDTINFEELEK